MHGFQRLKKILASSTGTKQFTQLALVALAVVAAFALYTVGIRFLLLPVLVAVNAWILPLPRIFASWAGRLAVSLLLIMAFLQVAASLQFLAFPKSGFITLTVFLMLVQLAVWLVAPQREVVKTPIISASDLCGLLVVIGFLLPFAPIMAGHSSVDRIATISTYQAVDGTTHYALIAEQVHAGHFNYSPGHYYPYGFHTALGYIQDTLFGAQSNLSWRGNVFLYFGDYLIYGGLLGYMVYFLCLSWLKPFKEKLVPEGWSWVKLLTALSLTPVIAIMYLLPFAHEGFLNYYYVCLTLILGVIFLTEMRYSRSAKDDSLNVARDIHGSWDLIAYLLLLFGASAAWPLILPPFAVTGLLFLLPGRSSFKAFTSKVWTPGILPIVVAFALQLLPLYFQLHYGTTSGQNGLNATGGITPFHPLILLAGVALVVGVVALAKVDEAHRRLLTNIFGPLYVFMGVLVICQYFSVGALRYYPIKISVLIEMLIVALGVATLVAAFAASKLYEFRYACFFPALPMLIVLLMISTTSNPLKYDRDLLMPQLPWYLKADIQAVAKLGAAGKINHANMTVLHYNPANNTFFADMQLPYWADLMQYHAGLQGSQELSCIGKIYHDETFAIFATAKLQQRELHSDVAACITAAQQRHQPFYIVTDASSLPRVQKLLGNIPVYDWYAYQ